MGDYFWSRAKKIFLLKLEKQIKSLNLILCKWKILNRGFIQNPSRIKKDFLFITNMGLQKECAISRRLEKVKKGRFEWNQILKSIFKSQVLI